MTKSPSSRPTTLDDAGLAAAAKAPGRRPGLPALSLTRCSLPSLSTSQLGQRLVDEAPLVGAGQAAGGDLLGGQRVSSAICALRSRTAARVSRSICSCARVELRSTWRLASVVISALASRPPARAIEYLGRLLAHLGERLLVLLQQALRLGARLARRLDAVLDTVAALVDDACSGPNAYFRSTNTESRT